LAQVISTTFLRLNYEQLRGKASWGLASRVNPAAQQAILHEIFGNPFRPYAAPASWPGVVIEPAQALYDGTGDRLILPDALEEAGHKELAQHVRDEEWHPRGCWVVDLLLGKE